jgi:NADH-quinone oxidoreductase subunit F
VTEQQLDVPLSFEGTRAIGATLGSGAVIVLDDTADLKQIVLRIARFFRDESCGQCVPCRVGTVRQEEVLQRLLTDRRDSDVTLLSDIAQAMRDASICGLGQTAANAITSAVIQLKVV